MSEPIVVVEKKAEKWHDRIDAGDLLILVLVVATIALAWMGFQELASMFGGGGLTAFNNKQKRDDLEKKTITTNETLTNLIQGKQAETTVRQQEDEDIGRAYREEQARVEEMDDDDLLGAAQRLFDAARERRNP